jgi:hypothetical protein
VQKAGKPEPKAFEPSRIIFSTLEAKQNFWKIRQFHPGEEADFAVYGKRDLRMGWLVAAWTSNTTIFYAEYSSIRLYSKLGYVTIAWWDAVL